MKRRCRLIALAALLCLVLPIVACQREAELPPPFTLSEVFGQTTYRPGPEGSWMPAYA
jgi:hypothetical protein